MSSLLFSPLTIRGLTLKNRIVVSPMCMYSAKDGVANLFHLTHLGAMANGGAGVVMVEATGIVPEGRISTGCLSLSNDQQMNAFKPIVQVIKNQNAAPAIQLAHSGRKGSFSTPDDSGPSRFLTLSEGGWQVQAPSPIAFNKDYGTPQELSVSEMLKIKDQFLSSAKRALEAGFEIIEIHAAHGYLLHEFLSPLSNHRTDEFGGIIENRMRFPLMVAQALREFWPNNLPVFVRISATDWSEGGWTIEDSLIFTNELKKIGIDLIDVSTGGNVADAKIPVAPGYQVPFAKAIKEKNNILTGAVGLIDDPMMAEKILQNNEASLIFLGRALLRNPNWPLHAAKLLGDKIKAPAQYFRAFQ